jgi:isochorismate synthase
MLDLSTRILFTVCNFAIDKMKIENNFYDLFAQLNDVKRPFVLYRLPNTDSLQLIQQNNTTHYRTSTLTEEGFVFAPFNRTNQFTYIPNHRVLQVDIPIPKARVNSQIVSNTFAQKTYYNKLVSNALEYIKKGEIKKVVVSRLHKQEFKQNIAESFIRLVDAYPNAMVYYWSHPQTGTWMGATPETLLNLEAKKCKTMALAGTLTYEENNPSKWSTKEIEEQQMVTDFIKQQLDVLYPKNNINPSAAYTKRAGNLLHLCADFEFDINEASLLELVQLLHPTPAVSGVPVNKSLDFIKTFETHQRNYYAGFLGPFVKEAANIYVNLRCAIIEKTQLTLYVGGGITAESNIAAEWEESQRKAETLLNVI